MDGIVHDVGKWDLLIAHPPCTYLSNAGANRLFPGGKLNIERYYQGMVGKALFMAFYKCDIPKKCIENPLPSTIFELPKYTQVIQPYEHGHPVQKRTFLWLENLPKIIPTNVLPKPEKSCHDGHSWYSKGGKDRQKNRSKTFPGIAKAMAEQWGLNDERQE